MEVPDGERHICPWRVGQDVLLTWRHDDCLDAALVQGDDGDQRFSSEELDIARLDDDKVCALWTPRSWPVRRVLKAAKLFARLIVDRLLSVEVVDLDVLAVLVEVLLPLDVKDRCSQVLQVGCRLWDLIVFVCLHDLTELWHQACCQLLFSELELIKDRRSKSSLLLISHLDERDPKRFIGRWVERNVNCAVFHLDLLIAEHLLDQGHQLRNLLFFTNWQIIDDEVIGEVVIQFWRVIRRKGIYCLWSNVLNGSSQMVVAYLTKPAKSGVFLELILEVKLREECLQLRPAVILVIDCILKLF